ncbi:MAG: hypothetical protein IPJ65_41955 [Archangiaceae bacterium]|nr:hypothetical protein [Archangiaceae bacterium]
MSASFSELVADLVLAFARHLELDTLEVEPRFAQAEGVFRGKPARMATVAVRGGPVGFARFVVLEGDGLQIGNVLALPAAHFALPIFGADLVALGGGDTVVAAADLSPVAHGSVPVVLEQPALPPGGDLPPWASRWFSPQALFTRTGAHDFQGVKDAVSGYARAWLRLAASAEAGVRDYSPEHRAYCRDHREGDRTLGMLGKIFGADFARDYVRQVFFPEVVS